MLENLKERSSFSMAWRLVVNGQVRHIRHTEIMARDKKHIIVCIKNIDEEVRLELAMRADRKRSVTYTQIAERLADHYDLIYYIDCVSSHYTELSTKKKSGKLKVQDETGQKFVDNRITLRVIRADGSVFFKKVFTKGNFDAQLDDDYRKTGILEGLVFDKVDGNNLVFAGSVSHPQTDEYIPLVVTVSNFGNISIKRDDQMDTNSTQEPQPQENQVTDEDGV